MEYIHVEYMYVYIYICLGKGLEGALRRCSRDFKEVFRSLRKFSWKLGKCSGIDDFPKNKNIFPGFRNFLHSDKKWSPE